MANAFVLDNSLVSMGIVLLLVKGIIKNLSHYLNYC